MNVDSLKVQNHKTYLNLHMDNTEISPYGETAIYASGFDNHPVTLLENLKTFILKFIRKMKIILMLN